MADYIHQVYYYETDKMGITHHSNYIRWMEEARSQMLENMGWPYDRLERLGLVSPVLAINCKYKESTTYPHRIGVDVRIKEYSGVRLTVEYNMYNMATGNTVFTGTSEHCFLNKSGKVARLKKEFPEFHRALQRVYEAEKAKGAE